MEEEHKGDAVGVEMNVVFLVLNEKSFRETSLD